MITLPLVRITLSDRGYRDVYGEDTDPSEIDITGDIDGEYAGEVVYKRDDISGVVPGISMPQKFYREAKDILSGLFGQYHIRAFCRINFYRRDPINFREYLSPDRFVLDFSTFSMEDDSVEIKIVPDDISSYVEANKGTKYDLPVSELQIEGQKKWNYERLRLIDSCKYDFVDIEYNGSNLGNYMPYIYFGGAELSGNTLHEFRDQDEKLAASVEDARENWFFKAGHDDTISIELEYEMTYEPHDLPTVPLAQMFFRLYLNSDALSFEVFANARYPIRKVFRVSLSNVQVKKGDVLFFLMSNYYKFSLTFNRIRQLSVNFVAAKNPNAFIDVIFPDFLLERLVSEMTGGRQGYSGVIEWPPVIGSSLHLEALVAAESIRNFPNANIHTSFNDFRKWMETLGFRLYYPDSRTLVFKKLAYLYDDTKIVMEIDENDCAGLVVSAEAKHVYTGIEVGYDLPEYDSANGRYEFNGKFNYSTGHVAKSNVLNLVSPYRADSIGIELLCWKDSQYKPSTDDQSDNTVFVVALQEGSSYYEIPESSYIVVNGVKLFNWLLSPRELTLNNIQLIGISTNHLRFASTTANRDLAWLQSDIMPSSKLFQPFTYEIACDWRVAVPSGEELNGVILFKYKGKTYRGFLSEAEKDYAKETETKLLLHALDSV